MRRVPADVYAAARRVYEAVRDHTAGLALLAELERLKGRETP